VLYADPWICKLLTCLNIKLSLNLSAHFHDHLTEVLAEWIYAHPHLKALLFNAGCIEKVILLNPEKNWGKSVLSFSRNTQKVHL